MDNPVLGLSHLAGRFLSVAQWFTPEGGGLPEPKVVLGIRDLDVLEGQSIVDGRVELVDRLGFQQRVRDEHAQLEVEPGIAESAMMDPWPRWVDGTVGLRSDL